MDVSRNKLLSITFYTVCIIAYVFVSFVFYNSLFKLNYYLLIITIPALLLFLSLAISSTMKLLIIVFSMIFGRNDNDEVLEYTTALMNFVNRIERYVLFGIFLAFLSSIMIFDIILCAKKEQYTLVSVSIVVWIILHYLLFKNIITLVKNERK